MARVERLNILLETMIKDKFKEHADAMGLTESALGAYIIGQWVRQQEMVMGPMIKMAKEVIEREAKEIKKEMKENDIY